MSTGGGRDHGGGRAGLDRWAAGRKVLRAADPRMAALVDADPELDPEAWMDRVPSDLWGALVLQVIGQQLSLAAAAAILARLEALHGGRLPTPAELLGMDAQALRQIGLSKAKGVYLHDLAARLKDGRLDLERLRTLDDDAARNELTQVKGVGRFTADGVLMLALRRQDVWPAADLALRRAVERVWGLDAPASLAQVDALGERFRPWRTLAAAYLYRTSSKIGTTPARVSSWENRGVMPSGKYLARLPKALGVTADELLRAIDADGKRTRET